MQTDMYIVGFFVFFVGFFFFFLAVGLNFLNFRMNLYFSSKISNSFTVVLFLLL